MATAYLYRNDGTWVSYWELGELPTIAAGTPTYLHTDGRTYIPLSQGGSSGGSESSEGGVSYLTINGVRWVSYWEPFEVPILSAGTETYFHNNRVYVRYTSGGTSSNTGGSIQPGDYYRGAFSPGPAWSPGPAIPRFDPPIRPPAERSGILFPLDVCWLLDAHEGQDEEIYARVDMDMGPARLRRKYTVVPHVRKAKIFLTFEESKVFHEWFEWTLGVGQLRWIGQFHEIGYGIRWFEAEFVKPWEAEYVALGTTNEEGNAGRAWKISIEVRLYGEGQIHNPQLDPSVPANLQAAFKLPLVTKNSPTLVNFLTAEFSLPLTSQYSNVKLEAAFELPLEGRALPPAGMRAEFFTYLSSAARIDGWERFDTAFTLPLV